MQEITKSEFNRYVNHLRPLFPGYMFVAFDPESSPWRQVNCTIGVSRIVSFGGQPQSVPHNLVTGLMQRCDASGKLLPTKELNKGDEVQLLTGPFANYIAKVETIDAKERVWVLMEFMGQVTRTSVEKNQLKTLT